MDNHKIRTTSKKHCYLCNSKGKNLYSGIKDRLFGVKGSWNIDKCSNNDCGLLWLNPMPTVEDLPKLYETYYTHAHTQPSKKPNKLVQLFRNGCNEYLKNKYQYPHNGSLPGKLIAKIIKLNPRWTTNLDFSVFYLPAMPNGKLLEIGCGNGDMLKKMQDIGWNGTGVDFDKKSISVAQDLGLNVHEGDICDLNIKKNSFDVIIMNHVIEHLPDPGSTLKECQNLLRTGGKLICVTPNSKGILHSRYKKSYLHLDPPRHLHLFNKKNLKQLTLQAGFKEASCFTSIHAFSGLSWASEQLSKNGRFSMASKIPKNRLALLSAKELLAGYLLKLNIIEGDEVVLTAKK